MAIIQLSGGYVAVVDDVDFEYLNQWKWSRLRGRNTSYAIRTVQVELEKTYILMHQVIIQRAGLPPGWGDHEDGDGLNNRRRNLRSSTPSQNGANQRLRTNNTSGFKGVSWHKLGKKWAAAITVAGKTIHLGLFTTPQAAATAYNEAAITYFGSFARLNVIQERE